MKFNIIDSCGKVNVKAKLKKQLLYTMKNSDFYRNKLKGFKINIEHFKDIPFTTKKEVLQDQEKYSPFGSNLCVNTRKIQRIHSTSGTTNKPYIIALTNKDIKNIVKAGAKCFKTAGVKNYDTVVHCLNYCMWAGGYTDHQSLEATGATIIPFGVGNSHNLIDTIKNLDVNVISCTPSYLAKLELVLKNEFNLTPKDLNLTLGLFGAESGLQYPEFRKKIKETWGMTPVNANFGMADVLSMFGSECKENDGLHFISEGNLYVELLNVDSMKMIPIERGSVGELVLTNIDKEAQPLIRYRSGDIVKIIDTGRCKCGLKSFRFEVIGRSDDMIVIKGLNVFPHQIKTILAKHLDEVTGEFQILVKRDSPIENLDIYIESKNIIDVLGILRNKLCNEIRDKIYLYPNITFVKEGTIERSEGKTKHIKYEV